MLAPIDSKASFEAEGETVVLRLNFRSLALADAEGLDLLANQPLTTAKLAVIIHCLAVQDRPDLTEDQALAIVLRANAPAKKALTDLFRQFLQQAGADAGAEGKEATTTGES